MDLASYLNVFAIVNTLLIVFGIAANILGAVVLSRIQRKVPGVRLLKHLAVLDVLILCLMFITSCLHQFSGMSSRTFDNIINVMFVTFPMLSSCYMCEGYLTVLIGCQRALVLVFPHRYHVMKKDSLVNKILLGIALFTIIFNIPVWMELQYIDVWIDVFNSTIISSLPSEDFNNTFLNIYNQYIVVIVRAIVPVLALIACNIAIIVTMRKRGGSSSVVQTGFDLARTNVAIIMMSIISYITAALWRMIDFPLRLFQLVQFVVILNSSANFIFYCVCSKLVRSTLKEMFKKIFRCKAKSGPGEMPLQVHQNPNSNGSSSEQTTETSL